MLQINLKGQLRVDELCAQDGLSDLSHWVQELVGQESDCPEKRNDCAVSKCCSAEEETLGNQSKEQVSLRGSSGYGSLETLSTVCVSVEE